VNATVTSPSAPTTLLSKVDTVLVKFFFTNPRLIPEGIRRDRKVSSMKQEQIDFGNGSVAEAVGRKDLAQVGRIRENRVDTGRQVVNNLQLVQLGILRRGLANSQYQLRTVHTFFKPYTATSSSKHVVVLVFKKGGYYEEATATPQEREAHKLLNSSEIVDSIRELARTTWQWCHVWDNSETKPTVTVNVGGRLPSGRPRHAIAVRGGDIVAVPVSHEMSESEE
jgi:hypothetical protein